MARKAPFRERLTRRVAIARGRFAHSRPGGAPRAPSVFFHMPKCGGTSLSEAMYATVPLSERVGVIDASSTRRAAAMQHFGRDDLNLCHEDREHGHLTFALREAMLLQHMAWDTMLIHGHVLWSDRAFAHFGDRYKYVTLLRDPIARTVSNFRMAHRLGLIEGDLDAYLDSPMGWRQAQVYLRYLSGQTDISEANQGAALALAQSRLDSFALIGCLDRLDAFLEAYRDLFGVRLRMAQLNRAPDRQPDVSKAQLARLEALCAPDLVLWEGVRTGWSMAA